MIDVLLPVREVGVNTMDMAAVADTLGADVEATDGAGSADEVRVEHR
jgi:hypothetical protein